MFWKNFEWIDGQTFLSSLSVADMSSVCSLNIVYRGLDLNITLIYDYV